MVKNKNEVYKCSVCGNIVEILHVGGGELVCCNKPMVLQEENTEDAAQEKHVPIVEKTDKGFLVKVGEVAHPMDEDHYIQWIEIIADGKVYRKDLSPGDEPQAEFCVEASEVQARSYCNIHGLWRS